MAFVCCLQTHRDGILLTNAQQRGNRNEQQMQKTSQSRKGSSAPNNMIREMTKASMWNKNRSMGLTHLIQDSSPDKRQRDLLFRSEHTNLTIIGASFSASMGAGPGMPRRGQPVWAREPPPQHHNPDQEILFHLGTAIHRWSRSMPEEKDSWVRHPGCFM